MSADLFPKWVMDAIQTCPKCGERTDDDFNCTPCADKLQRALKNLAHGPGEFVEFPVNPR